jgi:hypothetical protein
MGDGITLQSSTLATPAAGVEVATDDCGADGHTQVFKQAISTDGSATLIPATAADGMLVNLGANNDVVTTSTASLRPTATSAGLTTSATAYTAGDQLGTILTFSSAVAASAGGGLLVAATLLDEVKITGDVWLYLFDRSVTLAADNAAADFSDGDMAFCLGVVKFPQGDDVTSNRFAQWPTSTSPPFLLKANSGTSIYGALVTQSGHTVFTAVTNLKVALHVQPD